jgi:hypothetical protein
VIDVLSNAGANVLDTGDCFNARGARVHDLLDQLGALFDAQAALGAGPALHYRASAASRPLFQLLQHLVRDALDQRLDFNVSVAHPSSAGRPGRPWTAGAVAVVLWVWLVVALPASQKNAPGHIPSGCGYTATVYNK